MQRQLLHTIIKNLPRVGFMIVGFALLTFIILPIFNTHLPKNPSAVTYVVICEIKQATEAFVEQNGSITVTNNNLIVELLTKKSKPSFINFPSEWLDKHGCVIDAWGTPLEFRFDHNKDIMIVSSYGADKKPDESKHDDISVIIQMTQPTPTTPSVNSYTNTAQHTQSPTNSIHKDAKYQ
jgi:hypothetical protein